MTRPKPLAMLWRAALALTVMVAAGSAVAFPAPDERPEPMDTGDLLLFAHRGVVTESIPDNSLAALEEAIRRGYTHVEVDLRATKDGHAVCIHDDSLRLVAGVHKRVSELTLAELRARVPVEIVPDFATFCARAAGRIGLMPDIKPWPEAVEAEFAASIESALVKHGLLEDAYFIGRRELTGAFERPARISWRPSVEEAKAALEEHGELSHRFFAFGRAERFDEEQIRFYQEIGLPIVISINAFHYLTVGPHLEHGSRDVRRMLELGVDGLQIDAVYEPYVRAYLEQLDSGDAAKAQASNAYHQGASEGGE